MVLKFIDLKSQLFAEKLSLKTVVFKVFIKTSHQFFLLFYKKQ